MDHYAGVDVSLERSSVCVVDATGKIVREAKVASEPEALVRFFRELGVPLTRVGLEAGPLSQWLHAGLSEAGYEAVLLETRHVKAALSAMVVKTDRKDARGIARLLRMGWYRPVHRKSPDAQEVRALLAGLPATAAEDRLLPPRAGIAGRLGPHPPGLAPLGAEQAVQEQPRRDRDPLLREERPDPPLHLPQRDGPQLQRILDRDARHP